MAYERLIERFGGPNCAVPSAQVTEPARHVTVSNRLTDEQMCAGESTLMCVQVCACASKSISLYFVITSSFRELRQEFSVSNHREVTNANARCESSFSA